MRTAGANRARAGSRNTAGRLGTLCRMARTRTAGVPTLSAPKLVSLLAGDASRRSLHESSKVAIAEKDQPVSQQGPECPVCRAAINRRGRRFPTLRISYEFAGDLFEPLRQINILL